MYTPVQEMKLPTPLNDRIWTFETQASNLNLVFVDRKIMSYYFLLLLSSLSGDINNMVPIQLQ